MKPRYPWLQAVNEWTGEIIEGASWEEDIPRGWKRAFGEKMVDELNCILEKANYADNYMIMQIKEKFGSLRWYDYGLPEEYYEEYTNWLHKYEDLSYKTCITCGEPSTHMTTGWVVPLCDKCDKKV